MEQVHIAMLAFPAQGHQSPMMRLACRLASRGNIRITFFTSEWFMESAKGALEEEFKDVIELVSISKGVVEEGDMQGSNSAINEMLKASKEMEDPFERLFQTLVEADGGVQCLVGDILLFWPQDTANKFGIPFAGLWAGSTACAIFMFVLQELMSKGYVPVEETMPKLGNVALEDIPGMPNLHLADVPFLFYPSDQDGLEINASIGKRMLEASCILLNTCSVEKEAVEGLQGGLPCPCWHVGPLLPNSILKEDSEKSVPTMKFGELEADRSCLKWLDNQPASSVIYISFGSLANLSMEQFQELALGLEASEAAFLWVLRPNLIMEHDKEDIFVQDFLERTKDMGIVVSWAPQLEVLKHPAIGLFLTHCGWNSTMEAIWNGVPLLTWPSFVDQNLNARYIVSHWRVGLSVNEQVMCEPGAFVSRQQVETAIRSGLKDEEIRANMKNASLSARMGVKEGGSSSSNIANFVASIKPVGR